ncbi:sugar ABC transporter permease [Candidatus Bipolaricaulota bacterium]|nr:sugar ABC transporter permease [Candidatus Bipolaricaulota bacterium]
MKAKKVLQKLTPYGFLAPAILVFGLALFYPVFYSIRLSFFKWRLVDVYSKAPEFVGIQNYLDIVQSTAFQTSLKVTGIFITVTLAAELIVGMGLALLAERKIKGLHIFRTIFLLPIMVAPVVVGVLWRFMFNPNYGLVNYFIGLMGFEHITWLSQPFTALTAVILTDIWQWTPFVFLMLLAGLQNVPEDVLEASIVDGASYIQRLRHVKLPMIKSIIGLTIVLRLIDGLRALVVMYVMTNGGPGRSTEVLSLHIYKKAFISRRLGEASTLAVFLIMILLIVSTLLFQFFSTARRTQA